MISDRFTARVLGLLLIVLAVIIDASLLFLGDPAARQKPGFPLLVILPSLPFVGAGIFLLRRAARLPEVED